MYALCVSGAVNTQGFVWKFFMRYIYIFIHSFIHSFIQNVAYSRQGFILLLACGSLRRGFILLPVVLNDQNISLVEGRNQPVVLNAQDISLVEDRNQPVVLNAQDISLVEG